MKHEKLIKRISVSIAVIGMTGCAALLFPQMRQVLIGIGERILGRSLNADIWNHLLLVTALVYFCIFTAFLIIFFSKLEIPQLPPEKKGLIFTITETGLIFLYSCMLIFLALTSNAVRLDEAYSLTQIRHSWNDLIQLLIIDVHPPFYFLVLKAASLVFGSGIAAMKMVSVFPTILMVVFVTLFLKKEFSDKAAIIFLLVCIASQSITFYAIEIRMYSWALFFVTLMAVSSWYFFKSGKKRWWIAMLLCALGSAYTHNFAAAGAGIMYISLFFYALKYKKDKIIAIILLAVFGIALYLPWLPSLIGQFSRASGDFWIEPLTMRTIFDFIMVVFSTGNLFVNLFLLFTFAFVFVSFFIRRHKTEKYFFFFGGLCCAVLLLLTGIFMSIAVRPLFTARYLIPMCGLVWLFFAIEYSVINKRVMAFICVVLISVGIMSFYLSAHKEIRESRDFNAFYTHFTERMQQDDAFIFIPLNSMDSLHMVGIINYLFPDNIYTVNAIYRYNPAVGLFSKIWGGKYIVYEDNIFHDRTVWIFVMESEKETNALQEINGEFSGSFGWDFYRFRLYRRLPNTIP